MSEPLLTYYQLCLNHIELLKAVRRDCVIRQRQNEVSLEALDKAIAEIDKARTQPTLAEPKEKK